jgi:hypothetical protein
MTALTTTSTSANPWAEAGAGAGSTTYVKFKGASGDFLAGPDEEEIPHGTRYAADIPQSKWVWAFWWEGEVLESIETRVEVAPGAWDNEPDHLPEDYDGDMSLDEIRKAQADRATNFMDGWGCQAVLGMREIGGQNTEYTIKLNQGVALGSFRTLLASYGRQFQFKEGMVPIIELGVSSFKSKTKGVGKRYSPVLKIVDWKTEEELMAAGGDNPEDYEDDDRPDTPVKSQTKAISKAKDEAEETPVRGRRGARGSNFGE